MLTLGEVVFDPRFLLLNSHFNMARTEKNKIDDNLAYLRRFDLSRFQHCVSVTLFEHSLWDQFVNHYTPTYAQKEREGECISESEREWERDWAKERDSERVSEWMNEWEYERVSGWVKAREVTSLMQMWECERKIERVEAWLSKIERESGYVLVWGKWLDWGNCEREKEWVT